MTKDKLSKIQILGFVIFALIVMTAFVIDFLTDLQLAKPVTSAITVLCFILQVVEMKKHSKSNKNDLINKNQY